MILKKPYAFLIKHFRLIHFILLCLLGYVAYRFLSIVNFFGDYVKSGYITSVVTGLVGKYTPIILYFAIIVIIIAVLSILILLRHKKKPIKLYLSIFIYYLIMLILILYISFLFMSLKDSLISSQLSRTIRDIVFIYQFPQYIIIIFVFIRAIGFNIKKFSFNSDSEEFGYNSKDNEEFEVNFKFDSYKIKQKYNRILREAVYYIKENKFYFIVILGVLLLVFGYLIISNRQSNHDSNYRLGSEFIYNKLKITFEEAMTTNLDYRGNIIDGNYYTVIKTHVVNQSGHSIQFDPNNFKLNVNNSNINPTVNYAKYFIDFAPNVIPHSISHNKELTFALVYKINKNQINSGKKLSIFNGTIYQKGQPIEKHINIKINGKVYDNLQVVGNYKKGQDITFDDTLLEKTTFKLKDYSIAKDYIYEYEYCASKNCQKYKDKIGLSTRNVKYDRKLLILNVDYIQDEEVSYNNSYTSMESFAENFIKIQYKIDDNVYDDKFTNVTPQNAKDFLAYEVPSEIEKASLIQIIIVIRNKEYIINIM